MEKNIDSTSLINDSKIKEKEDPSLIIQKEEEIPKKKESKKDEEIKNPKNEIQTDKNKRQKMYIVFTVYLLATVVLLPILYNYFNEKLDQIYNENNMISFIIFLGSIICSLLLSSLISYYECLIKTHFFGIFFIIILFAFNNYFILYSGIHLKIYKPFFCSLVILFSGSFGLMIISLISTDKSISMCYLYIFNSFFSFSAGVVVYYFVFDKDFLILIVSIIAFFLSVFNIYSSQYKFLLLFSEDKSEKKDKKDKNENKDQKDTKKKKDILMYSQPFELNISALKFIFLLICYIIKFIKCLIKCCCQKKNKEKGTDNKETDNKSEAER